MPTSGLEREDAIGAIRALTEPFSSLSYERRVGQRAHSWSETALIIAIVARDGTGDKGGRSKVIVGQ